MMLYDVLFLVFTLYRHRNRIPFDAITIPIVELLIDNANAQMGSVEHVHIFCNTQSFAAAFNYFPMSQTTPNI